MPEGGPQWSGPPWRAFRDAGPSGSPPRPSFRPPWWPEGEPFPPTDQIAWRGRRRRFARRVGLAIAVFFGLTFMASALAVALLSRAVGPRGHGALTILAGILGLGLLIAALAAVGRAVRRTAGPLSDVMEAADRLAAGDYDVRVQERGPRDVRRLARSFNAMATRLRAGEEQRRNLVADVAHELRTPLAVIQGNAEGMIDGLYPADRTHLEPLVEETRVMARLLDDLQTLGTAEAGALRLHRQMIEPRQMAEDAVAAYRSGADSAGVSLRLVGSSELPALEADPVRIGQVLANLLSNALRHTPPGGSVTVLVGLAGRSHDVQFTVQDSGPGIPPEALPHVFERFVKSADSGGAGLGLAIARSLVEAHGGEITAESQPGQGTTMRFVLHAPERQ